jgi:hypothetical protein
MWIQLQPDPATGDIHLKQGDVLARNNCDPRIPLFTVQNVDAFAEERVCGWMVTLDITYLAVKNHFKNLRRVTAWRHDGVSNDSYGALRPDGRGYVGHPEVADNVGVGVVDIKIAPRRRPLSGNAHFATPSPLP